MLLIELPATRHRLARRLQEYLPIAMVLVVHVLLYFFLDDIDVIETRDWTQSALYPFDRILVKAHRRVPKCWQGRVKVANMPTQVNPLVIDPELLLILLLILIILLVLLRQLHEHVVHLLPLLVVQFAHPRLSLELKAALAPFVFLDGLHEDLDLLQIVHFDAAFKRIVRLELEVVAAPVCGLPEWRQVRAAVFRL